MRVGVGYDSHRFDPERRLILGGIHIPGQPGLAGFSDGDALAHAVTDAVLGAAGHGDIGRHFSPGDERWRDADSVELLRSAVEMVQDSGFHVSNVDAVVISERIRISPVADGMRERLAAAMGVARSAVSIKGKSNEGLGWIGADEGLAVHAVALLEGRPS